jgi:hypothetical protein
LSPRPKRCAPWPHRCTQRVPHVGHALPAKALVAAAAAAIEEVRCGLGGSDADGKTGAEVSDAGGCGVEEAICPTQRTGKLRGSRFVTQVWMDVSQLGSINARRAIVQNAQSDAEFHMHWGAGIGDTAKTRGTKLTRRAQETARRSRESHTGSGMKTAIRARTAAKRGNATKGQVRANR